MSRRKIKRDQAGSGRKVPCPVCHKPVTPPAQESKTYNPDYPFCSNRCKLIDLDLWLDGDYKIVSRLDQEPPDDGPLASNNS